MTSFKKLSPAEYGELLAIGALTTNNGAYLIPKEVVAGYWPAATDLFGQQIAKRFKALGITGVMTGLGNEDLGQAIAMHLAAQCQEAKPTLIKGTMEEEPSRFGYNVTTPVFRINQHAPTKDKQVLIADWEFHFPDKTGWQDTHLTEMIGEIEEQGGIVAGICTVLKPNIVHRHTIPDGYEKGLFNTIPYHILIPDAT